MIIKSVDLETVCGVTSRLPENTLPEFAFAGKSNVGKSSLINDEPQVLCQNLVPAGKDADHQFLQHQSGAVLCRSAWIRLRKGFSGGQGKVGKDDRAVSAEIPHA